MLEIREVMIERRSVAGIDEEGAEHDEKVVDRWTLWRADVSDELAERQVAAHGARLETPDYETSPLKQYRLLAGENRIDTADDPETFHSQRMYYERMADDAAWKIVDSRTGETLESFVERDARLAEEAKYEMTQTAIVDAVENGDPS